MNEGYREEFRDQSWRRVFLGSRFTAEVGKKAGYVIFTCIYKAATVSRVLCWANWERGELCETWKLHFRWQSSATPEKRM